MEKKPREDRNEPEEKRSRVEPKPLRQFQKIPIFVVDFHNEVLEFIYRCFGSRHLPLTNNTLIHFDSHPDMVITKNVPAATVENKDFLLNELSIENWIMPTLYAGQFTHLVWMKNSWCKQIPTGKHNFKVGEHEDQMYVDLAMDYFISEGNYCETEHLESPKDVKFDVYNVDEYVEPIDVESYVLDIDLDFFSTKNPFLEIYEKAKCYERLKNIFRYEWTEKSLSESKGRRNMLENLKEAFEYIDEHKSLEGFPNTAVPEPTMVELKELITEMHKHYTQEEIEWSLVYDAGCTSDNNGLPHHISTNEELEAHYDRFKVFLQGMSRAPVVVTISRSSEDDYCPVSQVTGIQERVIKILRDVFGEHIHSKAIMHYLNESWDVMDY